MITKKNIAQALLAGAALAAISSPSFAKPNDQLTIAAMASEDVRTKLSTWIADGNPN